MTPYNRFVTPYDPLLLLLYNEDDFMRTLGVLSLLLLVSRYR